MTADKNHNTRLDLTLQETVPDETGLGLVVERAWLPMVIWEGVSVVMRSMQGLTMMERFVVECLLTLKECQIGELQEIASIPPEMANWLLSSLNQKGLVRQEDGESFRPETDECVQALEQKGVYTKHKGQLTFIWFPETDEMVAIQESGNLIRQLRHLSPSRKFPLPEKRRYVKRSEIILEAKESGRLYGDHVASISDVDDDVVLDMDTCPAYYSRAVLPHQGADGWYLALTGYRPRKQQLNPEGQHKYTGDVESVKQTLQVPLLPGLVDFWRRRLSDAQESIWHNLGQLYDLAQVDFEDGQLLATVPREAAENLSRDRLLVNRIGLGVCLTGEIEYAIPLRLQPASEDKDAKNMFAVDKVVQQVLAAPIASQVVDSACLEADVSMADVVKRLWQLKLFRKVYDLREAEDFIR